MSPFGSLFFSSSIFDLVSLSAKIYTQMLSLQSVDVSQHMAG